MYVTTQRTSKPLKAASLGALALIVGSFFEISADPQFAAWMFVLGVIALPIVRFLIWWNHS